MIVAQRALVRRREGSRCAAGLTLIELLISITVLGILAGVAMPLVQVSVTRTK
jgi:prepilin-type N-terminal cleavage/methylation domain-containing protein